MTKEAKKESALDAVKIFLASTLESVSALIVKALKIIRSVSTAIKSMVFRK